jgi:PIN domain nuclease of toxin-antitoxin system
VRLLLDTHVALWFFDDPALLTGEARAAIEDSRNASFVSAASVWEWALKTGTGRIRMAIPLDAAAARAGFQELSITWDHGREAADLPRLHRDPFDRMLVAQARLEDLVLVTRDARVRQYEVATMEA